MRSAVACLSCTHYLSLQHHNPLPCFCQVVGSGETCNAGTNDCNIGADVLVELWVLLDLLLDIPAEGGWLERFAE
jgi:hypothetical protein